MVRHRNVFWITALLSMGPLVAALAQAIPEAQIDKSRIYFGMPGSFENPGEVDMEVALQSTPEFVEMKKKRIEHGTAKYWILVADANDRVHRAIGVVGRATDYDLIAEKGYLGKLDPPVDCDDITEAVVDRILAE